MLKNQNLRDRTFDYAVRVVTLCEALPNSMAGRNVGGQLFRCGTSVGAQHREAYRAKSNADFVSKMESVLQELDESAFWLELISNTQLLEPQRLKPLMDETDQLTAIFVASIRTVKGKSKRSV